MPNVDGMSFGKYRLISRLAAGGMGETYLAQLQASAGVTKSVVIKKMLGRLAGQPTQVEAFIEEARVSASLSHGNIAQVFDFGEVDGEYFLAMEYVPGHSLEQVVKRAKDVGLQKLPFEVSVYVIIELLKALHYAHTRVGPGGRSLNLVHRDVAPDNIMLGYEGEVKLVDFGVAKSDLQGRTETEPGVVKGKFRYLSPEQVRAEPLDARSDIFNVGIVFYELLSGAPLFRGPSHDVMLAIATRSIEPLRTRAPKVPVVLSDIAERALRPSAGERFATALVMQEALSRWLYQEAPELSSAVLRELMGELFEAELRGVGSPFVRQLEATRVWQSLKSGTRQPKARAPITASLPATELPGAPPPLVEEPRTLPETKPSVQRTAPPAAPVPSRRRGYGAAAVVAWVVLVGIGVAALSRQADPSEPSATGCTDRPLGLARQALESGDPKAARQHLKAPVSDCVPVEGRPLVEWQREVMRTRIDAALARDAAAEFATASPTSVPNAAPSPVAKVATPTVEKEDPHEQMLGSALKLLHDLKGEGARSTRLKLEQAREVLERCTTRYPESFECHRMLAVTFGMLGDGEQGAREFESFLRYAPPGHPQMDQVKALLRAHRRAGSR